MDFEKRIAQIYQECRTEEEIQSSFDALQNDLETQIDETIDLTRQKLLENFDEEVHEKLKVNLKESKNYLSKYEDWLWELTKHHLAPYADFAPDEHSFSLRENPFPEEHIHSGPYRIGKNIEDANIYRIGHPLAQKVIASVMAQELQPNKLDFKLSKVISILEPYVGKSGWLKVMRLTVNSFETEDHILLAGVSDDGEYLDAEQCRRLFSLPASTLPLNTDIPASESAALSDLSSKQEAEILQTSAERNSQYFDDEMGKLDKWAEDVKTSIELELKELDRNIKAKKTEAKKILKLEDKVAAQREIKNMEKRRSTLRQNLYHAQDEIDDRKEKLIEEVEAKLKQQVEKHELFTIRWSLS